MLEKDPDHRISLPAAISHPWVTVEGSVRSEALSITEEPGASDGGGVQVGLLRVFVCVVLFSFINLLDNLVCDLPLCMHACVRILCL